MEGQMDLEEILKRELNTGTLNGFGVAGGGNVCKGEAYNVDSGKIYVKINTNQEARMMFDGEFASLKAISETRTILSPKPEKVIDYHNGALLVTDYLEITELKDGHVASGLGHRLARMHLHNGKVIEKTAKTDQSVHKELTADDPPAAVTQFGFHTTTCCGIIPKDNTWQQNWVIFLIRQLLQPQINLIEERFNDKEIDYKWKLLLPRVERFFTNLQITPALLHGDLWYGNAGQVGDMPIIFDACSFYGHSEFEMGMITMWDGYPTEFLESYHELIPITPGFEDRIKLYKLFNYLNHWNHFGHVERADYRKLTLQTMTELIDKADQLVNRQ